MAIIKLGETQINTERLGFPASVTPTPDQVGLKIAGLLDERDGWREKAEDAQGRLKVMKEFERKNKELECSLFLDDAVRSFKLDKAEVPFLTKMWEKDPASVKEHVDKLRVKAYLKQEVGMSGDDVAPDATAEFAAKVMEKISHDPKMTQAQAAKLVYAETPGLFERMQEERRNAQPSGGGKG